MNFEESLVFSYLRRIKKCKIIQCEWFPCMDEWSILSRKANDIMNTAKNYFKNKYRIELFQDMTSFNDISINNAISAFGISFNEDYTEKIYGVSCNIYNHDNDDKYIKTIVENIIITGIYMISCFNKIEGNIIYLGANEKFNIIKQLGVYYADIKEIFAQVQCNFDIKIYINEEFENEVIKKLSVISNDSELDNNEEYLKFLRINSNLNNKTDSSQSEKIEIAVTKEVQINNEKTEHSKALIEENIEEKEINTDAKPIEVKEDANKKGLNVVIDDDIKGFLFNDDGNKEEKEEIPHTTSYYMNRHNVKTQFSVDGSSINKIIEERKKRIVKELLESKASQTLNEKYTDIKITELVKNEFNALFEQEKVPRGEIRKLQEQEYSQQTFGIRYPVLRKVNMNNSLEEQRRDSNGNAIYYGFLFTVYDNDYYLCSDWSEENRIKLLRYLSFFR